MPGPYDFYDSDRPTIGSNIRWGLSGDSFASSLAPDLGLVLGGSVLETMALRRSTGSPMFNKNDPRLFGLGGILKTDAEVKSLKAGASAGLKGSRMFKAGMALKGLGLWFGAAQLMTGMASMTRGIGNAITNAKPIRNVAPPAKFASTFFDSSGAYTMRQRAISAIHNSQLSTRASLDNLASFYHN